MRRINDKIRTAVDVIASKHNLEPAEKQAALTWLLRPNQMTCGRWDRFSATVQNAVKDAAALVRGDR